MEIDVKSKSKSNSYNYDSSKSFKSNSSSYKNGNTQNKSNNNSTVTNPSPQAKVTVNINYASAGELVSAGFTQSQANAIIEFRDYKGAFGSVTDLLKVNGITQDVLYSLIGNLTV